MTSHQQSAEVIRDMLGGYTVITAREWYKAQIGVSTNNFRGLERFLAATANCDKCITSDTINKLYIATRVRRNSGIFVCPACAFKLTRSELPPL